jgi:hypothetical protein
VPEKGLVEDISYSALSVRPSIWQFHPAVIQIVTRFAPDAPVLDLEERFIHTAMRLGIFPKGEIQNTGQRRVRPASS